MKKIIVFLLNLLFAYNLSFGANLDTINIVDFSGGLNTRDGSGQIADNELYESYNCYLDKKAIVKRNGYTRYNNSARVDSDSVGTGIYQATFTAASKIIVVAGSHIKYKGTNTWTDITGNVVITNGYINDFCMVYNNVVSVNGTNPAWYYTGSDSCFTLSGENIFTAPTSCEQYKNRLFLAQGNQLSWSNYLGDWKTFHPDDYQKFEENITGLKVIGTGSQSVLMVFTQHSITQCIFDADLSSIVGGRGSFRFELMTREHGCISSHSIQECLTDDGSIVLIWADMDGLKAYAGDKIIKLTDKIQPDWDELYATRLTNMVGLTYKPKRWYLLACSSGTNTTNDRVIVFDLRNWTVSGYFDWTINCFGIITSGNAENIIGCDYSGYWNTYDNGTNDNSTAINAYFTTKSYDNNQPFTEKGFKAINFLYEYKGQYTLDYTITYDFKDVYSNSFTPSSYGQAGRLGSFILGVNKVGTSSGTIITGKEVFGRGRLAQIKIENGNADEPFKLYRMSLIYEPGNMVILR